jgi:hypothetical protein
MGAPSIGLVDFWSSVPHDLFNKHHCFFRSIDARFNSIDGGLYILEFDKFEMNSGKSVIAEVNSG